MSMRGTHEAEMIRMAMRTAPLDAELQADSRTSALAAKRIANPITVDAAMHKKCQDELRANQGFLERQREANEGTNFVSEAHPMQDAPFNAVDIWFSSGRQTIGGGGVDQIFTPVGYTVDGTIPKGFVGIMRSIQLITFDALAETDLRLTVQINGTPQGVIRVAPSALMNFRLNSTFHAMQGWLYQIVVRNLSAVNPHDFIVQAHGWLFPVPEQKETARGVIPKLS